jgi:hypothetical protein
VLERLREIDDELNQLPEQLAPLAEQVERAKEILKQAEEANPTRQTLLQLLRRAERSDVGNIGWCAGQQSSDAAMVAAQVAKLLFSAAGKTPGPPPDPTNTDAQGAAAGNSYEAGLALFVKGDGGLTASNLEGLVLRKLFTDPWIGLDSQIRARIMEELKREAKENSKWLPEPRSQILDEEGKALVGEGAGAFGGYFAAAATISMTLRQFRLQPPAPSFSSLNATMSRLLEDAVFKKLNTRLLDTATNIERARAVLAVAYVHLIRANQMGFYEREHRKIVDALSSAEVALESGQKRVLRLRTDRTEIVMQLAGIAGIAMTILAILAYLLYGLLNNEPPPAK